MITIELEELMKPPDLVGLHLVSTLEGLSVGSSCVWALESSLLSTLLSWKKKALTTTNLE
jgi:hypothetical protein